VLLEQFRDRSQGFNLAEVQANLLDPSPLVLGRLEESRFFDLNELWEGLIGLIGEPVRLVITQPPLYLVLCLILASRHVALNFVDPADDLVSDLPESCKLGTVGGPNLFGGVEP
jgi:hypothetical protein